MSDADKRETERLAELVGARGRQWFGSIEEMRPQLEWKRRRHASTVYLFRLQPGDRRIVVKVPRVLPVPSSRPRVRRRAAIRDSRDRAQVTALALSAAEKHFRGVGDLRLQSIRLLDRLEDPDAVVTEYLPWPNLHRLVLDAATRRRRWRALAGMANAGAWLRSYHDSRPSEVALPRDDRRGDYLITLDALGGHLLHELGGDRSVERLVESARRGASTILPDIVPLATAHGDFGLANVLVGPRGQVAVLDLNGRWLAPPFEDIASLLTSVGTIGVSLLSQGLIVSRELVREAEHAFLEGYYGPVQPPSALALYRVNALLDVWGSKLERLAGWQRPLVNRALHQQLGELAEALAAKVAG